MTARFSTLALAAGLALAGSEARALDKQVPAHGGAVGESGGGFQISGALIAGVAAVNDSYAARPDNTGLTLMRYAGHVDLDLIGRRLSIPVDVNMFTDRLREGAGKLAPTELDLLTGVTSAWVLGPGELELGSRIEHDRPLDRAGVSQTYLDARARYRYSGSALVPALDRALKGGDLHGWLTLGWFAYNPSYFARPDNSGLALLRYAVHTELSLLDDLVSVVVDATMFTDRHESALRPSELDLTTEVVLHTRAFELHLAYERDMPLDDQGRRPGFVQDFVYLLGVWSFSVLEDQPPPALEHRTPIVSP